MKISSKYRERQLKKSHGFYDGRRIRSLFSFDIFYVRKKKSFASKKSKRFWVKEIFKKRAANQLYSNLAHELRTGDKAFLFQVSFSNNICIGISKAYK